MSKVLISLLVAVALPAAFCSVSGAAAAAGVVSPQHDDYQPHNHQGHSALSQMDTLANSIVSAAITSRHDSHQTTQKSHHSGLISRSQLPPNYPTKSTSESAATSARGRPGTGAKWLNFSRILLAVNVTSPGLSPSVSTAPLPSASPNISPVITPSPPLSPSPVIVPPSPALSPSPQISPPTSPSTSPSPSQSPQVPSTSPPVTPSPTTPGSPSVTPSPSSQSPAVPSPSPPQQSPSPSPRVSPDPNAVMPENVTQQEGTTVVTGQVNADTVTVNMILPATSDGEFQSKHKDQVSAITATLSGTPRDRWQLATNQQVQLRGQSGRRLLDTASGCRTSQPRSRRHLLQTQQGLAVSLSLYTNEPQLVWYRLKQPVLTASAIGSSGSASSAAASEVIRCTTEYCARLIRAGVPVDPNSITISPDYEKLLNGGNGSTTDRNQDKLNSQQLVGIIVGSVSGAVVLLVIIIQRKRLAACWRSGCAVEAPATTTAADSSKDKKQQAQQVNGHNKTPYYDRYQKPGDDICYDFNVPQSPSVTTESSTSTGGPTGMHYRQDHQALDHQVFDPSQTYTSAAATPAAAPMQMPTTVDTPAAYGQYYSSVQQPAPRATAANEGVAVAGDVPSVMRFDSAKKRKYKAAAAAAAEKPITAVTGSTSSPPSPASTAAPSVSEFSLSGGSSNMAATARKQTFSGFQTTTPWTSLHETHVVSTDQQQHAAPKEEEVEEEVLDAGYPSFKEAFPATMERPAHDSCSKSSSEGWSDDGNDEKDQPAVVPQQKHQQQLQPQSPRHARALDPLEQQALANYFARTKQHIHNSKFVPYTNADAK